MIVLGIKKNAVVDFYDNKKGQQVHLEGLYLYLGDKANDVEGVTCIKPVFIGNTKQCFEGCKALKPNDVVNVYYNRFGSIDVVVAQ